MPEPLLSTFEIVADYGCEIGENPLWHPLEKRVYWTDIPTGRLFRFDQTTGLHEQIYQGRPVGGFTFEESGALLLFRDHGNVALWRGETAVNIIDKIPAEQGSRFNDVIADPVGRVFCGTMSSKNSQGRLYRLDLDGGLTQILCDVGCPNGMGFTPDLRGFFFTDSFARTIYQFDYHIKDGTLTNQRVFARIPECNGLPDGLTVDENGNVWSALWDGRSIVRFGSEGNLDIRLPLPTPKVSSLTFGGDDLRDIYVSTAGGNLEESNIAGALLRIRCNIRGRPEFFSKIAPSPPGGMNV